MGSHIESDSPFTGDYARDFETWAEYYDSDPELAVLEKHVDWDGEDVLEAGCGSGRLSFRVASDDVTMTSVDIVPSLVTLCHRRLIREFEGDQTKLRFEVQDLLDLPYPDDHFDAILDGWTFSTLEDFERGAREYKRVLAADGTILAIEFGEGSPYQEIVDEFVPDDAYEDELPPPDEMMEDAFGVPDVTEDIVSEYRFESVEEAVGAFVFNFTEWLGLELTDAERAALRDRVAEYRTDTGVAIDEYATFYKFEDPE